MLSILRAVARFLRSIPRLVMTPVYAAGAIIGWITSLILPPAGNEAQDAADDAAQAVQAPPLAVSQADRHLAAVQASCAEIAAGQVPTPAMLSLLPGRVREWLLELSPVEAHALLALPEDGLRAALRGSDVGVLVVDRDHVDERRRERRRMIPDPAGVSAGVMPGVRL